MDNGGAIVQQILGLSVGSALAVSVVFLTAGYFLTTWFSGRGKDSSNQVTVQLSNVIVDLNRTITVITGEFKQSSQETTSALDKVKSSIDAITQANLNGTQGIVDAFYVFNDTVDRRILASTKAIQDHDDQARGWVDGIMGEISGLKDQVVKFISLAEGQVSCSSEMADKLIIALDKANEFAEKIVQIEKLSQRRHEDEENKIAILDNPVVIVADVPVAELVSSGTGRDTGDSGGDRAGSPSQDS